MSTKQRQSSTCSEDLSRYEFVDYTTASDFEKLVTLIEETLLSWGLHDGVLLDTQHQETLSLGEETFEFSYHYQPTPTDNKDLSFFDIYRFSTKSFHPLHRWTGHDRLMVLKPMLKKKIFHANPSTVYLSQAKYLISSCAVAFQNIGCRVPVFVPVGQGRHDLYTGYMLTTQTDTAYDQTETRYSMTLTTPPTSPLNSLDGLKALFLQKLSVFRENEGQPGDTDNVWLSAIYTYNLKNWFDERWKEWEPVEKRRISFSDDFDDWDQQEDTKTPMPLPFGSLNDPLRTLTLAAIFPSRHLSEFCWSPMDGLTASQWQIAREFAPASQQRAYLSRLLQNAVHSWIQDPANREYLAPYDEANEDASSDRVMRSLFGPNSSTDPITLIKSDQVETVLTRLFEPTQQEEPHERVRWKLHHGSTVPYRSFLWNMILYSLQTVAQQDAQQGRQQTNFIGFLRVVWLEVLKQIRWHWDHREPLPDLNPYLYNDNDKTLGIDLRYNMLHQKLAMVNCCIVRQSQEPMASEPMSDASSEEDSDVFVDAMDDEESSFVSLPCADQEAIQDPEKAEGQLEPHPTLTLLQTGQVMQIPITQDPGFMTEDMVTEQADVLRSLGTSDDATQKRARLQSAQLLSDMQAFKAANPYACLEDFVRWYSPRDWVDGQLSTRMSEPNNIWQELWQSSKRIPCSRQKPLFDMKKEVEKALFYLETLSVHDMFAMMLPTLGWIAYDTLSSHPVVQSSKCVEKGLKDLGHQLSQFSWEAFSQGKVTFDTILDCVRHQESIMCHAISLTRKLPRQFQLVDQLLCHDQVIVQEGQERSAVFELFKSERNGIGEPSFREYILFSDCKDLRTRDQLVLPFRQYALVKDNEIRIVDMQSTDTLYI